MFIVSVLRLFRSIVSDARRMRLEAIHRHPHLGW